MALDQGPRRWIEVLDLAPWASIQRGGPRRIREVAFRGRPRGQEPLRLRFILQRIFNYEDRHVKNPVSLCSRFHFLSFYYLLLGELAGTQRKKTEHATFTSHFERRTGRTERLHKARAKTHGEDHATPF